MVLIPVVWSLFDIKTSRVIWNTNNLVKKSWDHGMRQKTLKKNSIPIPNSPKKPEMVGQPHVGNMFRQPLSQTSCIVMWHRVHSPGFGKLQACLLSSFYKSFPLHVSTKENFTKEAVRWFGSKGDYGRQGWWPELSSWASPVREERWLPWHLMESLGLHAFIGAHTCPLSCAWYDNQINVIIFYKKITSVCHRHDFLSEKS